VKILFPIYAFVGFLLSLAACAIVVGIHDASLARASLGVTAGSAVLLVVGVMLLIGAYKLARLTRRGLWHGETRPSCGPLVLSALLLATLVGVYVFFSAIRTAGPQRPVVVAVALMIIAFAATGLRFFGSEARVTLPRLGTIALGLIGTTIGAWEFWYQNQYVPSRAGRAVELKVNLDLVAHQPKHEVIQATVSYQGIGGRSVSVIGSTYTLTGSRVVRCERSATAKAVGAIFKGFLLDPQRTRFSADVWEQRPATVLAAGKFVGDGKRLEPHVPASRDFVFDVPRRRYQLLRFRAQLFAIPASVQLAQSTLPEYETFPRDNDLYGFWHIVDDSWLHDLIYGRERWVVLRYEIVSQPKATLTTPDLRVTARFPDPTWTRGRPTEMAVKKLFGELQPSDASEPFADSELALEAVAEPTARDSRPNRCRS
jgi:hypothetical protein